MFGRKKRGPRNPASNYGTTASSAAHTAAASAFLKNSTSNASLSATAAAAAALRARPTTPTVVGEVQTRRTMRRTNSTSSIGSSTAGSIGGPPPAQLERKGSSGSMTERTFRDPSPNRGPGQSPMEDVPPVPAIPKNIVPPVPARSHRRAMSMETPATRIASPLPNQVSGRGSSLDPIRRNQPPPRSALRGSSLSSVQELTDKDRPGSRGSVNFSYPTGLRECSPYGQRQLTSPTPSSASQRSTPAQYQNLVYDPNSRRFLPESELLFYQQSIRDAADRPVKKKNKVAVKGATGSHLADGTVGGRIHGTAVGTPEPSDESPQAQTRRQDSESPAELLRPRRKGKSSMAGVERGAGTFTPPASDYDSDNSERSPKNNARAGKSLAKRPSIVREDREREEAEDETSKALERQVTLQRLEAGTQERNISPSPQPRALSSRSQKPTPASVAAPDPQHDGHQQATSLTSSSPQTAVAPSVLDGATPTGNDSKVDDIKAPRVHSISPVRVAHFLSAPESLAVRHQPLGRSVSPMKSALKHSPSSRGSSPNGDAPLGATKRGSSISDASDTPTIGSEEPSLPRKKSVRVSFDDESNVVLGESDVNMSPDSQTTPGKKGWFTMGRGKKKDLKPVNDDDSEIMKPRPALPSFGSIREKKFRDDDERSLVTPMEPTGLPRAPTNPLTTTTNSEATPYSTGQSSDHALGAVIAEDQASKLTTPHKMSNEPLPPEVTSVEGSGYISDDASSTYSVGKVDSTTQREHVVQNDSPRGVEGAESVGIPIRHRSDTTQEPEILPFKSNGNGVVPALALTRPSPILAEIEHKNQRQDMPGQFPESPESSLDGNPPSAAEHYPTDLTPAALGIAEPDPILQPPGSPKIGDIATDNKHSSPHEVEEKTEDSDNDSIYSDAAEDFTDMQGDGFMSLDAVVESPAGAGFGSLAVSSPIDSPSVRNPRVNAHEKSELSIESNEPQSDDGWDQAQRYWSGLPAEKRQEMEQAALQEISDKSKQEVAPATMTQQKKKSVVNTPTRTDQVTTSRSGPHHNRTYQIAPGAKAGPNVPVPAMRSSMRTITEDRDDSMRMRKSMRNDGSTRGSNSVVPTPQQKASLQKYRPRSTAQPKIGPTTPQPENRAVALPNSSTPTGSTGKSQPTSRPVPTLRRKGSNESDSSFKRARPATEGYHMKRSLRGSPQQQTPQSTEVTSKSGRYTLRSLSPPSPSSRLSPPLSMPKTMRHTRRNSDDSYTPTLRSSVPDRSKSPLRFPRFGQSKPQPKPQSKSQPKAKAVPSRASRFADSSDEEDARPSFRSRFVDSSDEDEDSNPLPAVKTKPAVASALPRRNNNRDGDSSDLPDTDDEKPPHPSRSVKTAKITAPADSRMTPTQDDNAPASVHLRRSGSGREFLAGSTTITSISARPLAKQRGSFISILRRKKPDPSSKVRKSDIESAARRDTPLERSRADLMAVKRQDSNMSTASEVASPKLLKRGVPSRTSTNENWPLTSTAAQDADNKDEERPHTADGSDTGSVANGKESSAVNGRPDLGSRRSTATGLADVDLSTVTPTKKKKRFPMLRKAFRLDI